MTKISYIQGPPKVPKNELADRGREVSAAPDYIPFLGMTEGEMSLALLREQLKLYARAYPDFPQYRQGLTMVENALYNGISGYNFLGAVPDELVNIAQLIDRAKSLNQTAGGELFAEKRPKGIYIGEIIPTTKEDCRWLASVAMGKKYWGNDPNAWPRISDWESLPPGGSFPIKREANKDEWMKLVEECEFRKEMEILLNEKLEKSSHHMLYKGIPSNYPPMSGTNMGLKRILHLAGIESLANAAGVSVDNMKAWVEIGVQRSSALANIGPLGSVESGFYVATNGNDKAYQDFLAWAAGNNRPGGRIGIAPAVVIAIIGLVSAALSAAVEIVKAVNVRKVAALASAQGFGTSAYSPEKGDLNVGGAVTPGKDNTGLLIAAAAGAYLLLNDE